MTLFCFFFQINRAKETYRSLTPVTSADKEVATILLEFSQESFTQEEKHAHEGSSKV